MIEGSWAVVEMLGHRRIIGQLSEEEVCGVKLLRIERPDGQWTLAAPASLYCITPVTEEHARAHYGEPAELVAVADAYVDEPWDDE